MRPPVGVGIVVVVSNIWNVTSISNNITISQLALSSRSELESSTARVTSAKFTKQQLVDESVS